MTSLLFATHNSWKEAQFSPTFADYGFKMFILRAWSQDNPDFEETGVTPVDNALQKARRFHSPDNPWVFADDAGLEIDALNGEPGTQTRRWNGRFPDDIDDQAWLNYLLHRMQDAPPEKRTARFHSGWALIAPDGSEFLHSCVWPFEIAVEPIRPIHPGSPISAVRIGPPDDLNHRRMEIRCEFDRWGILKVICSKFGVKK